MVTMYFIKIREQKYDFSPSIWKEFLSALRIKVEEKKSYLGDLWLLEEDYVIF